MTTPDPTPFPDGIDKETLLTAANRAAEAATVLADRYATAIADISAALSQGGDAAMNRVRLVIASLGEDAADTSEPTPTMPPLPTEPESVIRATIDEGPWVIFLDQYGCWRFTSTMMTVDVPLITSWSPLTTDAETLEKVDVEALREAHRIAWSGPTKPYGSYSMAVQDFLDRVDEVQGR